MTWEVEGFLQYTDFLYQENWPPEYNWNIVESGSGAKHHNPSPNPLENAVNKNAYNINKLPVYSVVEHDSVS